MTRYLALLRGINVGGNSLIKMADLKVALTAAGLQDIQTYIQSGNVLFSSAATDTAGLAETIEKRILKSFGLTVSVAVFNKAQWQRIIAAAPRWWGEDNAWKHNLFVAIRPHTPDEIVAAIGELKSDIERVEAGDGVVYQSMSFQQSGRTTSSKLIFHPLYKKITIRSYNTAVKLRDLLY